MDDSDGDRLPVPLPPLLVGLIRGEREEDGEEVGLEDTLGERDPEMEGLPDLPPLPETLAVGESFEVGVSEGVNVDKPGVAVDSGREGVGVEVGVLPPTPPNPPGGLGVPVVVGLVAPVAVWHGDRVEEGDVEVERLVPPVGVPPFREVGVG